MLQNNHENHRVIMSFPQADSVCAIGEFNNWSTVATPLTQAGEDEWELQIPTGVQLEKLAFFVIAQGARFGQIMQCGRSAQAG